MIAIADRRELGGYLSSLDPSLLLESSLDFTSACERLDKARYVLEFDDALLEGNLPRRIVVRDDEIDDFFAWTSTYVDALAPLTGFVEVVGVKEASASHISKAYTRRELGALIGAVLTDALLQSRTRLRVPDTILPAALRTLSAVFYQTTIAGSETTEIADAAALWATTRESLGGSELPFAIRHVLSFWGKLIPGMLAGDQGDDLAKVVRKYLSDGTAETPWLQSKWANEFTVQPKIMLSASREERLKYVDRRVSAISDEVESEAAAAYGGYLLALVADGDYGLWPTAVSYTKLPTLALWFGFFVGGSDRGNIFSVNQAVGRRLISLLRYRSNDVDVDARELLISRRVRTKSQAVLDFPTASHAVLKARLSRNVCGWFSVRDSNAASQRDPDLGRQGFPEPPRAIIEARAAAERIVNLLSPLIHHPARSADSPRVSAMPVAEESTLRPGVRSSDDDAQLPLDVARDSERPKAASKKRPRRY